MKGKITFLLVLLVVLAANVQAQNKDKKKDKDSKPQYIETHLNEIYFEYGSPGVIWGTVEPVLIKTERIATSPLGESLLTLIDDILFGGSLYDDLSIYGFKCYGVAALSYQRRVRDQQWLGLGFEVSYAYSKVRGGNEEETTDVPVHILMPTFNVNFYYFRRSVIEIYSGLTAGLGMWMDSESTYCFYAGHFNALGVSVGGKQLRAHCEIGAGMKGTINIGLGYKF